ncbi:MAG: TolC family protein [Verrucomicrobiales bacterium]|nr:TolC family protein [Verrucomicrobiales bacterium]
MRFTPVIILKGTLALALSTGGIFMAAAAERTERQMSLADCITVALEHNFDLQIERYNPLIADSNLRLAYADYDPAMRFSANHSYSQSPGGRDARGDFSGRTTETDDLRASVGGAMPYGLSYGIQARANDSYGQEPRTGTNGLSQLFGFDSSQSDAAAVELRQALLKNFWIDGTLINIRLRKKSLQQSDLALRMSLITTVHGVEEAYYNLMAARENVKSAEIALELAKKLYEENRKRVEVGAMAQLDERQAQAQMASAESDLIEAKRTVDQRENVLKLLLSDKYEDWHKVSIVPAEKLEALPEALDVESSWEEAFTLRPDLLSLSIEIEKGVLNLRYSRNQLLPQLDAVGTLGWQGSGSEFSDSLDQVGQGSAPHYSYGLELSFPLSNRAARERHRQNRDTQAQAELRLRQARQQVMVGIHDAIQEADSSFQRVGSRRAARVFAEEALAAEEKKLANGKSTSFEVLRLQRDLTAARYQETSALSDYNRALALVRQRKATSLKKFNLETATEATKQVDELKKAKQ